MAPKDKGNAPTPREAKKRKRGREELIRLDDLISNQGVKGGRQLPFGVTYTTQTANNPK